MGAWVRGCIAVHGGVGAWARGCVGAWVHGCVRAWVRGCVDAWVRGCVGVWTRGRRGRWVLTHSPKAGSSANSVGTLAWPCSFTNRRSAAKRSSHMPGFITTHSNLMRCSFFTRAALIPYSTPGATGLSALALQLRRVRAPLGADPQAQGRVAGELRGHPGVVVLLHELPQRREALVPHVWLHHPLEPDVLQLPHARHTDTHGSESWSPPVP